MRRRGRWPRATDPPTASGSPGIFGSFEQDDFGDADPRCDLARQRPGDHPPRPKPGQSVEHGKHQRPPRRQRLIRRARQRNDGNGSDPADGGSPARLHRDAMRDNSPRCAKAAIIASVRPTPVPPVVTSTSHAAGHRSPRRSRPHRALRPRLRTTSAPAARAFSAISFAVAALPVAAGILTTRRRGRRTFSLPNPPCARSGDRADERGARGGSRNQLPRYRRPAGERPAPVSPPPAPEPSGRSDRPNRHRRRSRKHPAWGRRLRPRPGVWPMAAANRTTRRRGRGRATPSHRRRRCRAAETPQGGHIGADAAQRLGKRKRYWRDRLEADAATTRAPRRAE